MQLRWLQHTALIILFLFLSTYVPKCISQRTPPAPPISRPPPGSIPPVPVSLPPLPSTDVQKFQTELMNLTNSITNELAKKFDFCISDTEKDWNETFGFSNTTFVGKCIGETQGDLSTRICTQNEIKFYFSLFTASGMASFLKPNKNCNLTSWTAGCNPGWACSLTGDQNQAQGASKDYKNLIPHRIDNCQRCCEGFFCPRGLTCMIPCPLGAYCPVADLNGTTGICDPYGYQAPNGNPNNTCGSADIWADVGHSESMFCPSGYYCPDTVQKLNCTDGHFCKLGSISQSKCLFKSSCDPNAEKENIFFVGVFLIVAISVLLLIFYNFTGIFLHIRERRRARSRAVAVERANETLQARKRWKDIAKRNINRLATQVPRSISRQRISISHDEPTEEPGTLLSHPTVLSDESAMTTKKNVPGLYSEFEIQEDIENNTNNNENKGNEGTPKKKFHKKTRTQIFQNAYIEIEKEKAFQQENKNITFSAVFNQAQARKEKVMKRPLLEVAFKDLTLTLGKKKLLRSITGKLIPGKVTAVMGPSGAGKTTFLNAVAGKVIAGCKVSGSVLVNGKVGNIRSYKKIIGFVPQDDIVHGDLTVEENLWFSARCRLSANMREADKILLVERVIESLGLQGIRNSLVGTVEKRGISGGQRKRVNVGLEMVMEPSLLILDEPTSGLDSASSQLLLRALRREALEGVNIAAVIHQPSYTLYRMFDDIILLAKGGLTVYHGSIDKVEGYFSMLGMNVPDRVNPPDYFIDVLEGIEKPNSEIDIKHLPLQWILYNGYDVPKDMEGDLEELNGSDRNGQLSSVRSESLDASRSEVWDNVRYSNSEGTGKKKGIFKNSNDLSNRKTPGILKQFRFYFGRVVKQRLRGGKAQAIDYLILCLAGACLGTIARLKDTNFGIPGYIYTIIAISLLCKIAALKSFSQDQLQFWRERASGMSCLAYFLSKDTVDHFNTIVKPVVYLSMFYFFNNPRSLFVDNLAVMIGLVYCVTGVAYTFAICFKPASAQLWSALLPVVLTLLSTQSSTPMFLANLCYPKWALEGFVIANAKRYSGVWLITRCAILLKSGYHIKNWVLCLTVLFGYGLVFRIIAFLCLVLLQKK